MTNKSPVVIDDLISHRGAPLLAPENTLPSFREAARLGAKWIEVDVKLTADQKPIIIHDHTLERTTNGSGHVAGITFETARSLDAGSFFHPRFAGTRIPTLEELIELVLELDLGLQLELKPTPGDDVETAEVAIAVLKDLWPKNRERLFLSSFSTRSIARASQLLPDVPRAFAVAVPPRDAKALLDETDCQILHCKGKLTHLEALRRLNDSGVEYAISVINDPEEARHFLDAGAQSILTDVPNLFERIAKVTGS